MAAPEATWHSLPGWSRPGTSSKSRIECLSARTGLDRSRNGSQGTPNSLVPKRPRALRRLTGGRALDPFVLRHRSLSATRSLRGHWALERRHALRICRKLVKDQRKFAACFAGNCTRSPFRGDSVPLKQRLLRPQDLAFSTRWNPVCESSSAAAAIAPSEDLGCDRSPLSVAMSRGRPATTQLVSHSDGLSSSTPGADPVPPSSSRRMTRR